MNRSLTSTLRVATGAVEVLAVLEVVTAGFFPSTTARAVSSSSRAKVTTGIGRGFVIGVAATATLRSTKGTLGRPLPDIGRRSPRGATKAARVGISGRYRVVLVVGAAGLAVGTSFVTAVVTGNDVRKRRLVL